MSENKKINLPVITIVARSGTGGMVDKNSIILLDGKLINGLSNFNIEMNGDDPTGLPTINISLKGYVQVLQEAEESKDESS